MKEDEKIVGMMGLARRAGVLIFGFDRVVEKMRVGKVACAFITSDCSPKTKKEVRFFGNKYSTKVVELPIEMDDLKPLFGKRVGVTAIEDKALAERIESLSKENVEEECK